MNDYFTIIFLAILFLICLAEIRFLYSFTRRKKKKVQEPKHEEKNPAINRIDL